MGILNPKDKIAEIKSKQIPHEIAEAVPPICPFMSTPDREVSCTPRCKLYRQARKGYECYLQEMQSISWNTRKPAEPSYPQR